MNVPASTADLERPGRPSSAATPAEDSSGPKKHSPYIVSGPYDWIFFLLPPALALGLGILLADIDVLNREFRVMGMEYDALTLFILTFIHAHLVAVLFRSHGNPKIFRLHPVRFVIVPIVLFAAMLSSSWILIAVSVLATFWDVYHSGLQTFGFARMYDRKAGNDPAVGRRLDWWLNHLLYAGPILAGVTMMDHVGDFLEFESVEATFFTSIPALMDAHQAWFTWTILALGTVFLAYYVFAWHRLHRQGHKVSFPKVYLLASTGICSIYTWGFNSFGMAFFIMNFFHALQYLGIVWWAEKKNIIRVFGLENRTWGSTRAVLLFVGATFSYGFLAAVMPGDVEWWWSLTLMISILHFWYDGFVWSVRKKQV